MQTVDITIPEQTFDVITMPLALADLLAGADEDGVFSTHVRVSLDWYRDKVWRHQLGQAYKDRVCLSPLRGIAAHDRVVAVQGNQNLIIEVTLDMRTFLHGADKDMLETVPTPVLADAVRRFPGGLGGYVALSLRDDK